MERKIYPAGVLDGRTHGKLMGFVSMHMLRFLYFMHNEVAKHHNSDRPMWAKTEQSMLNMWFHRVDVNIIPEVLKRFGSTYTRQEIEHVSVVAGACLRNYYVQNEKATRPFDVKNSKTSERIAGRKVSCRIDQTREVSYRWIRDHAPTLLNFGKLPNDFIPYVGVVFESTLFAHAPDITRFYNNLLRYDVRGLRADQLFVVQARSRVLARHHNSKRSLSDYPRIFHVEHMAWPVGIIFYHLLTGLCFAYITAAHQEVYAQPSIKEGFVVERHGQFSLFTRVDAWERRPDNKSSNFLQTLTQVPWVPPPGEQ